MYFVVILVSSKKVLAIPAAYVLQLDVVGKMNTGLKKWKKQLVFFSPENHDPNFNLPIREDFDENVDGVYYANILKVCYTQEEATAVVESRRNVLPVNYFNRFVQDDNLDDSDSSSTDEPGQNIKQEPRSNAVDANSDDIIDVTLDESQLMFDGSSDDEEIQVSTIDVNVSKFNAIIFVFIFNHPNVLNNYMFILTAKYSRWLSTQCCRPFAS